MKSKITTLVVGVLTYLNVSGQKSEFVKSDSIIYPIHQSNIGKIAFMSQAIAIENFKATDFLESFELKEKTDLNIRVFLGHSLTNYLHLLSPQLPIEELTKNGNYQFTFIVDNKKIYVENLNAGAGNAESKNHKTMFRVPFLSTTNEDSWVDFFGIDFLAMVDKKHFQKENINLKLKSDPI